MNICMLTSSYPKYAGETTAPFIEEIAAGLARRGHCVHVVAPYHRDIRRGPVERGVHLHFFRYSPVASLNTWGYAESLKADVRLKGRTLAAAPLAAAAAVRALLRLTGGRRLVADEGRRTKDEISSPFSIHHAQFDLIHAHWVLPNGALAGLAAGLRGLPLVVSLHGSDVFLSEKAWPLSLAAGATLRAARAFTACSGDLRERALRLGAPAERATVIPYGVDVQAFQPDPRAGALVRQELGLPADAPLILALGRLVYKKGLTYLLEAMPAVLARYPRAKLVLAGYGDLREELERQAQALGIQPSVIFPGQLERARAARYISAADVYVVPSVRDQRGNIDGLPNTLLEGMAAARPIVASRIAGIPEVICDGRHGLLTPERDPRALAAAVMCLLDQPDLARSLGEAARRRVLQELTWDATAERFERVYQHVMRNA